MIALFFLSILALFINQGSVLLSESSHYLRDRSQKDQKAAELADRISQKITWIDEINLQIEMLYAACVAAENLVAIPPLKAAGTAFAMQQSFLLSAIQSERFENPHSNDFKPAQRLLAGPCGITGTLKWKPAPIVIYKFRTKDAGFDILRSKDDKAPEWHYANSDVRVPWL